MHGKKKEAPTKCQRGEQGPGEAWIEDTLTRLYFWAKHYTWRKLVISHEAFFFFYPLQRNETEMSRRDRKKKKERKWFLY